jgi:hypothetical protein
MVWNTWGIGIRFPAGAEVVLHSTASTSSIQWVLGTLFSGKKWPGHAADHSQISISHEVIISVLLPLLGNHMIHKAITMQCHGYK